MPRADIFAAGLVLFEMLSGRAAFGGTSAVDVLHAVAHEHPPALMGSPAVVDIDRVIQRAVAKAREDRYQIADDMATDVRAAMSRGGGGGDGAGACDQAAGRAAVQGAAAGSGSGFPGVQPPRRHHRVALGARLADGSFEPRRGAVRRRARWICGRWRRSSASRRRSPARCCTRAMPCASRCSSSKCPRAPCAGRTPRRWPLDDLFTIQDSVCSAVVDAFALKLTKKEHEALRQDVPASPEAYEHYLRANRLSTSAHAVAAGRAISTPRAVEADPSYAPAWARLGRVLRNIGKYGRTPDARAHYQRADEAFQRAFALNPDLPLTHNLYTYMEVETGRALDAVLRLLGRLKTRTNDPDLFAGLVQACRYVGLLDASVAAYHRATRLDPGIVTSVAHSYFMLGQYQRAIEVGSRSAAVRLAHRVSRARPARRSARRSARRPRAHAGAHPHVELMMQLFEAILTGRHARRPRRRSRSSTELSGLQRSGRLVLLGRRRAALRRRRRRSRMELLRTGRHHRLRLSARARIHAAVRSAARLSRSSRALVAPCARGPRGRRRWRSPKPTAIACSDCRAHDGGSRLADLIQSDSRLVLHAVGRRGAARHRPVPHGADRRRPAAAVRRCLPGRVRSDAARGREGALTPFQAFMTSLAASIGTGNIAGVATAIVSGGPGALFWIWVYGFVATAIKFAEAVLGVTFARRAATHDAVGADVLPARRPASPALAWTVRARRRGRGADDDAVHAAELDGARPRTPSSAFRGSCPASSSRC